MLTLYKNNLQDLKDEDAPKDTHSTKRESAIRAFNETPNSVFDDRILGGPSRYTIFSSLQWKDFSVKKGLGPLRNLPTATVRRSYWFHRLWNKFKSFFRKSTPTIPPEIVSKRSHRYL